MTTIRVTIAICTYNRRRDLTLVLEDLRPQLSAARDTEILIIDNNSTDGTTEMVREHSSGLPVRVVSEQRQGTVFARNRALAEGRGEYLIFLDDDIRVHPHWYDGYRRVLVDAKRIAVAGSVISTWPEHVPTWIGDTATPPFPGVTVHYFPYSTPQPISTKDALPFTANLGIRLDLARQIGFREDLGHVEGKPMGGDDMDFCGRFIATFGAIWYDPSIQVDHPVTPERMSLKHTFRYLFRGAVAEAWYSPPPEGRQLGPVPLWMFRVVGSQTAKVLAGIVTINSGRVVRGMGGLVRVTGTLWGLLRKADHSA